MCETCGQPITNREARRFCSRTCYAEHLRSQTPWNKGRKETRPEVIEKIKSAAQSRGQSPFKGRKHSDESRAKMSAGMKGRTAWNKGLKIGQWDEERKAKWTEARKRPRAINGSSKHDLSPAEHARLYLLQSGGCGICGGSLDKHEIDHCHKSKLVRGLLCGNCNRGIGLLQEDVEVLRSAITYLENPPAGSL